MPPAFFFFFFQSIRLEKQEKKKKRTYLAVLSFMMFASVRKTNNNQPMAYQNTERCRSRQPASSWDLQMKLREYIYTDEGGTSGRQSNAALRGNKHAKPSA